MLQMHRCAFVAIEAGREAALSGWYAMAHDFVDLERLAIGFQQLPATALPLPTQISRQAAPFQHQVRLQDGEPKNSWSHRVRPHQAAGLGGGLLTRYAQVHIPYRGNVFPNGADLREDMRVRR
jgi:hypothetical protein